MVSVRLACCRQCTKSVVETGPEPYSSDFDRCGKVWKLVFGILTSVEKSPKPSLWAGTERLNASDIKGGTVHTEEHVSAPKLRSMRRDECSVEGATVNAVACVTRSNTAQKLVHLRFSGDCFRRFSVAAFFFLKKKHSQAAVPE